jgi:hypothetical protein
MPASPLIQRLSWRLRLSARPRKAAASPLENPRQSNHFLGLDFCAGRLLQQLTAGRRHSGRMSEPLIAQVRRVTGKGYKLGNLQKVMAVMSTSGKQSNKYDGKNNAGYGRIGGIGGGRMDQQAMNSNGAEVATAATARPRVDG